MKGTQPLKRGESTVELRRNEMIRIVEDVFRTMLQTEAETSNGTAVVNASGIAAIVRFDGAWRGTLAVECSAAEAKRLALLFTGSDNETELESECKDVLGELANIVAGNLKVVLPKGTLAGMSEIREGLLNFGSQMDDPIHIRTLVAAHSEPISLLLEEKELTLEGDCVV